MRLRNDDLTAENYCLRHSVRKPRSKTAALIVLSICVLGLTICLCMLILAARHTVLILPDQIDATRAALVAQGNLLRVQSLREIDKQATNLQRGANAQLDAIRTQSLARIDSLTVTADRQITASRADLEVSLLRSLDMLVAPINGIRSDLQPVLANAAALTKDGQDSLDDLYPDVRGLVESAAVATTQTAQTMETVRTAAPEISAAAIQISNSAASIADSGAQEAKKFTAPQTTREKVMTWLQLVPRLALKIL